MQVRQRPAKWTDAAGKSAAKLERDAKGRVKLSFSKPLSDAAVKQLADAVGKILG